MATFDWTHPWNWKPVKILEETVLTPDQKTMIKKLKELNKANRPTPWGYGGKPNGRGKMTYNLYPHEEDLVISMRNNLGALIKIIEDQEAEIKRVALSY